MQDPFDLDFLSSKPAPKLPSPPPPQQAQVQAETPPRPQQTPKEPSSETRTHTNTNKNTNTNTDIDADIAQIIDMGFDAETAAIALEASGGRLSAAIDLLLQNSRETRPPSRSNFDQSRNSFDENVRHNRPRPSGESSSSSERDGISSAAQVFGATVLSNAKSLFHFSKKKMAEVMEKASTQLHALSEDRGQIRDGEERWRREGFERYSNESGRDRVGTGMGESDDEGSTGNEIVLPRRKKTEGTGRPDSFETQNGVLRSNATSVEEDLGSSSSTAFNHFASTVVEQPVPAKPVIVEVHTASAFQLEQAESFKNKGNESFKTGQFAEAVEWYSQGISCLPPEVSSSYDYLHLLIHVIYRTGL
jgi:hypothetical protein